MSEIEFIKTVGPLAAADMKKTGVLASVTIAQAILESGYGTTDLARNANNFFGMKCSLSGNTWASAWDGTSEYTKKTAEQKTDGTVYYVTADFRKYPDMETSINDHSLYLVGAKNGSKLRYEGLVGETDPKTAAQIIKDGGYATDITYVDKLCNIIERYDLTQYDVKEEVTDMSKKVLVVLDPGHVPNYNKGAVSGYYEGNKMYDFTEYERDALKAYGVDVIVTRKRENDMALYERGQVAVKNGKGYDVAVFISNHSNAFNGKACGVVVYRSLYLPGSADLGQKLVDAIVGVMKPVTGITYSRGVATRKGDSGADYYGVIRGSVSGAKTQAQAAKGPVKYSYIVEHGFHDNLTECKFLYNDANLKKMAEAEAKAIADYFGLTKSGGSTQDTGKTETVTQWYRVRKSWADSKSQVGAYKVLSNAKAKADETGLNVYDSSGKRVYTPAGSGDGTPFMVRVTIKDLNIRKGPGYKTYKSVGYCPVGTYTIAETKAAEGYTWGRLKSGIGWIALEYAQRV